MWSRNGKKGQGKAEGGAFQSRKGARRQCSALQAKPHDDGSRLAFCRQHRRHGLTSDFAKTHRQIERLHVLGQRAHGDIIHAGVGESAAASSPSRCRTPPAVRASPSAFNRLAHQVASVSKLSSMMMSAPASSASSSSLRLSTSTSTGTSGCSQKAFSTA